MSSAKPPNAIAMNGSTVPTILPPGWFGTQAKRAIGAPALSARTQMVSAFLVDSSTVVRRLGSSKRLEMSERSCPSRNLTASTSVVVSLGARPPGTLAATPATIAGRPMNSCRRCAAARAVQLGRRVGRRLEHDLVLERLRDAAQQLDDAAEIAAHRREARRIDALVVEHRVGETVVAIDHEDVVMIEERREPQPDQMMHPVGVEIVVELQDDIIRGRDILQFAHHAVAAVGDRLGQEPAFLLQFDVVGPLGRGQHRDDDAKNGNDDDDADRRSADRAATTVILARALLRQSRDSLSPHGRPPRLTVRLGWQGIGQCL